MLFSILMVVLPVFTTSAQPLPTVILEDFAEHDLFEFEINQGWSYLPESSEVSSAQVFESLDSFVQSSSNNITAGWWMFSLTNHSTISEFSLRFNGNYDTLELLLVKDAQIIRLDPVGLKVINNDDRVMDRLLTSSFILEPNESATLLVRRLSKDMQRPAVTLDRTADLESYSESYMQLSLIFSIIFLFILVYQLGTLALIRSRSYAYYSILAAGYLLHAFNYQFEGWTTPAFADDVTIISASFICVGGICLWKRFLQVSTGVWLWLFRIMKLTGFTVILVVTGYLIFPTFIPRLNGIASLVAALLASSVIGVWIVSSIIMSYHGRDNAKSYLLTNIPILIGGIFFVFVWASARYNWIILTGSITLLTNYVFFGSAVLQLLLFSLVIGITLKKRLTSSYQSEKNRKLELEESAKERTAELEKINTELNGKYRELERINNTKNRLLTILSHDLRSPLNNLASLVALLKEHQFSPEELSILIAELEESISDTTSFMSLLIHWTQSQNNGLEPKRLSFSAELLIKRTVEQLKPFIETKNIDLELSAGYSDIYADRNMIDLVLRNLLSNAIKFSHLNGKVELKCSKLNDRFVQIDVVDYGLGIDKSRFKDFFDVGRKNTTRGTIGEKGFGMGLILCKDFVELNGGKLLFESEKGKGSTFSVVIPSGDSVSLNSPLES